MPDDAKAPTCLLVLCGLPGAGKSALAANLTHIAADCGVRCSLVTFDDPPAAAAAAPVQPPSFDAESWKESRSRSLLTLASLLKEQQRQGERHLVIADDTMHYRGMRRECWRLARDARAAYLQAHVSCPLEEALRRNEQRPEAQRVPASVVHRAAQIFEPPWDAAAGWEAGTTLLVDATGSVHAAEVWRRVQAAWGPALAAVPNKDVVERERAAAQQATASSALHRADLACRQLLTATMQRLAHLQAQQKAPAAARLNEGRRRYLAALQQGQATAVQQAEGLAALQSLCEEEISLAGA